MFLSRDTVVLSRDNNSLLSRDNSLLSRDTDMSCDLIKSVSYYMPIDLLFYFLFYLYFVSLTPLALCRSLPVQFSLFTNKLLYIR